MWVRYIIQCEEDTPKIIDLFRLQYARLKNKILHLQSYASNLQKFKKQDKAGSAISWNKSSKLLKPDEDDELLIEAIKII